MSYRYKSASKKTDPRSSPCPHHILPSRQDLTTLSEATTTALKTYGRTPTAHSQTTELQTSSSLSLHSTSPKQQLTLPLRLVWSTLPPRANSNTITSSNNLLYSPLISTIINPCLLANES